MEGTPCKNNQPQVSSVRAAGDESVCHAPHSGGQSERSFLTRRRRGELLHVACRLKRGSHGHPLEALARVVGSAYWRRARRRTLFLVLFSSLEGRRARKTGIATTRLNCFRSYKLQQRASRRSFPGKGAAAVTEIK